MAAGALTLGTFDPYKENAYSEAVKFDLEPTTTTARMHDSLTRIKKYMTSVTPAAGGDDDPSVNPELSLKTSPSRHWRSDVSALVSTRAWLQNHGLKRNRLDMFHLLPKLGFRHSDEYDNCLKKPICSRYGEDLFKRYFRSDGRSYNLSCSAAQLSQVSARLGGAICLFRSRLDWLTSESRRLFGVVEEKTVCVVVDIRCLSPQRFDQYRSALERIIREQLTRVARFNIIRACEDLVPLSTECVPVTGETIEGAVRWLWALDRCAAIARSSTCEAVLKAIADKHMEAVYLFTEGSSSLGSGEILREKLTGISIPLHVVSYNCTEVDTIQFLKQLALVTGGRFHAYAVTMEMDSCERQPMGGERDNEANVIMRRKTYGGVPAGAGARPDVIELFEELEEAKSILGQIETLTAECSRTRVDAAPANWSTPDRRPLNNETYMSSADWLTRYGLKARGLGFYDVLAGVAFRHSDGVVQLLTAPHDEGRQTDAASRQKLVNARYCERFAHVRWKDGEVAHVHVTPEVERSYSRSVTVATHAMQQRIDWLQQGSRELFGTIVEDRIYFLIDTSASMAPHLQFVKDKMFVLMQEQLRHKQAFNILAFGSAVSAWRDALTAVSEKTLRHAWHWLRELDCFGSTNTLAALRQALGDPQTQAVYLLTDGRPNQPPEAILSQMQLHRPIPVHAISFNCAEQAANEFLCKLAQLTRGRFHFYSDQAMPGPGPEAWESEDIRLLKQEIRAGRRNLEKIAALRDECAALSWRTPEDDDVRCSRDHPLPDRGRDSAVPSLNPSDLYRPDTPSRLDRPSTAPGSQYAPPPPLTRTPRPASTLALHPKSSARTPQRSISAREVQPVFGGHNRSSILRTLSINNGLHWQLPETRAMFERQAERQHQLATADNEIVKKKVRKQKMKTDKPLSTRAWLSRYGLAARRLTIVDVLSSTFIRQRPKYVAILGKSVVSKVFDEVLPMAHTSGDKTHIINPQAVDLKSYITKVENATEKIESRLNRVVWEALSEDERKSFDATIPVSFVRHKVALLSALERSGWPVAERDVAAMEAELRLGATYVAQARELRDGRSTDRGDASTDRDDASTGSAERDGGTSPPSDRDPADPRTRNEVSSDDDESNGRSA